jgi:type I restriction enzyme R subunit
LDKAQLKALINTYIYSGQEPIRDDVFKCSLENSPNRVQARTIGERIIEKRKRICSRFLMKG